MVCGPGFSVIRLDQVRLPVKENPSASSLSKTTVTSVPAGVKWNLTNWVCWCGERVKSMKLLVSEETT